MNSLKSSRDRKYFEEFDPQIQKQIDEENSQQDSMKK